MNTNTNLITSLVTNWIYVKKLIMIGLRKSGIDDRTLTYTWKDGIDMFFFIPIGDGIIKVNIELADIWDVTFMDMYEVAVENMKDNVNCMSLPGFIAATGIEVTPVPVIILSNYDIFYGAGMMAVPEILGDICDKGNAEEIIVIPSSVHEVMIAPKEYMDGSEISEMVRVINHSSVMKEKDVLYDGAFIFSRKTMKLREIK